MKTFLEYIEAVGTLPSGEVVRAKDAWKMLELYNKPWHFVSFRGIPGKLGINPKYSNPTTAVAVYGYKVSDVLAGEVKYATNFPYAAIFNVKEAARPFIVNLDELDANSGPIVSKLKELGVSIDFHDLDDKTISSLNSVYSQVVGIPDFFAKAMRIAKDNRVYARLDTRRPVSSVFGLLYQKEFYDPEKPWALMSGTKPSMMKRKMFTSLGVRGILSGQDWRGARGGSHGAINNECIFFYPTDLEQLDEIIVQAGVMSDRAGFSLRKGVKDDSAGAVLNRNIEPKWGTPEKNDQLNPNLLSPRG